MTPAGIIAVIAGPCVRGRMDQRVRVEPLRAGGGAKREGEGDTNRREVSTR